MTGTRADWREGYRDGRDDAECDSDERLDALMLQGYPSRYIAGYEAGVLSVVDKRTPQ